MKWLGDKDTNHLEKIKEEDTSSTLNPSTSQSDTSMSLTEQTEESLGETTGSISTADGTQGPADAGVSDSSGDVVKETERLKTSPEEMNLENDLQDNTVTSSDDVISSKIETVEDNNRASDEITTSSCSKSSEHVTVEAISSDNTICSDDVILSSSSSPGLPNVENNLGSPGESEQLPHVTSTEPALQMYSTPKLEPYKEIVGDRGSEESDKDGYREGISRDSGIHESKEDFQEDTEDHRWIDQHHSGEFVFACAGLVRTWF